MRKLALMIMLFAFGMSANASDLSVRKNYGDKLPIVLIGECHKQGSFWNADCGVCTPPNSTCTRQPASWIKPTITGVFSVLVVVITLL